MTPLAEVKVAGRAALDKKAADLVILDLRAADAFTDFFVLASGSNPKQVLAIADAVLDTLRSRGIRPNHVEGYPRQEWILLDYTDFVVHIFSARARAFYDLERLWGGATRVELAG
jgi:ribosome-associated protein